MLINKYKRKFNRINCNVPVRVKLSSAIIQTKIEDISAGGCKINKSSFLFNALNEKDKIQIEFSFENIYFNFMGEVIRDTSGNCPVGIKFLYDNGFMKQKLNYMILNQYY